MTIFCNCFFTFAFGKLLLLTNSGVNRFEISAFERK